MAINLELPFGDAWATRRSLLQRDHYLGATRAELEYRDDFGLMTFTHPSSRRLPPDWLELNRWALIGTPNGGSRQWRRARQWLAGRTQTSTIVSYSDPSVGHTGALYRACGWLWAPTWLRLRPPPSGNGSWASGRPVVATKDRWVWPVRQDPHRADLLRIDDQSIRRRMPWAEYREPLWRGHRWRGGGGDYQRWARLHREVM